MKYGLVVYLKNECYKIEGISKIPGFEYINESKLKDIVEFTNEFENEQELICYLIDEGLLPKKFFKGSLGINFYKGKNNPPKTLQYGVSFKEDKKFFDTIFLKYYFREKLTNPTFMKAFVDKYYTYLRETPIFREEMGHIRYGYEFYLRNNYLPEGTEQFMATFIEIYCRKKSKDGYYKADFTRIRDLAMFAINYERTYEREMIERPNNTVEDLELMIDHYYTLMRNDMLSEEEMEAYTDAINNLEQELEYTKAVTLNRSKKNETTGN